MKYFKFIQKFIRSSAHQYQPIHQVSRRSLEWFWRHFPDKFSSIFLQDIHQEKGIILMSKQTNTCQQVFHEKSKYEIALFKSYAMHQKACNVKSKNVQSYKSHNSWSIFQNLFKSLLGHLLINTNLVTWFQGSSLNCFWDILLTKFHLYFLKDLNSWKGHNSDRKKTTLVSYIFSRRNPYMKF